MKEIRNWIIGSGVVLFLAFGGKSLATGQDMPEGIRGVLVLVLGAGLGAEPLLNIAGKALNKKKDGESE